MYHEKKLHNFQCCSPHNVLSLHTYRVHPKYFTLQTLCRLLPQGCLHIRMEVVMQGILRLLLVSKDMEHTYTKPHPHTQKHKTHTHTHPHTYTHTYTHSHTPTHNDTHTLTNTNIDSHTYTHSRTHTHSHTHTHTRSRCIKVF